MTATGKPWTPDMPLRADATDEQIVQRGGWMMGYVAGADGTYHRNLEKSNGFCVLAREYAAACVAAASKCECGRGFHQLCPVCDNDD